MTVKAQDEKDIVKFEKQIVDNLIAYMEENSISQEKLASLCRDNGYNIGQSTISRLCSRQRRVTVFYLHALTSSLGITMDELIGRKKKGIHLKKIMSESKSEVTEFFSVNPIKEYPDFRGYLGDFYIYFISAQINGNEKINRGRLTIEHKNGESYCYAGMKIKSSVLDYKGENVYKYYQGQFIISKVQNTAYLVLIGEGNGDIMVVACRHQIWTELNMQCRIATVLSSGIAEDFGPSIYKMVISRKALQEEEVEYLRTVLRLGRSAALVTKADYEQIMKNNQIDTQDQEKINRFLEVKEFVEISENIINEIRDRVLEEEVFYDFRKGIENKNVLAIDREGVTSIQDSQLLALLNFVDRRRGKE